MKVTDVEGNAPKVKVDFSQGTDVLCDECHTGLFISSYLIKHFSEVASPTGESLHIPIPIFACAACGHVNKAFYPKAMRKEPAQAPGTANINTILKP